MAMKIELRRVNRTKPESTYIRGFASNVTSQFGEDGMIAKIFDLIGVKNRWWVEFGAWDGKYLSNTWDLINNKGWSAVLAEGDRERAARLAETHRDRSSRVFVENAYPLPGEIQRVLQEVAVVLQHGRCIVDQPQRGFPRNVAAAQQKRQDEARG